MSKRLHTTLTTGSVVFLALSLQGCAGSSLSSTEGIAIAETIVTVASTTTTSTSTTSTSTTSTTVPATTTTTLPEIPRIIVSVEPLVEPLVAVGTADGEATSHVQERLLELGFWLQSTDGEYGVTTRQAVMAFQKYHGLATTAAVDDQTAALLSSLSERPFGRAQAGTLVEVDKSRQLAFFVNDGVTEWVLNVSTGSEIPYEEPNQNDPSKIERGDSITDPGLFKVDREREEGWWDGDLGSIYRPKYFNGGIAVHGSYSIPDYPASHGCVRVSTAAMDWIWDQDLMPMGTPVWVHGNVPT